MLHFISFKTVQIYLILLCFALLYFTDNAFYVATLHQASLLAPVFSSICSLHVFMSHISAMLTICQSFLLLLYLLWWFVTGDLWCYYCNCFGVLQTVPKYDGKFIHWLVCVCSDCSTNWPFLHLSPSLQASWFLDTILKLGQPRTLEWPLSVQGKSL